MPDRPTPTPRLRPAKATDEPPVDSSELIAKLDELRRKIRAVNKDRGRVSLTLHMTRLELAKARADRNTAATAGEEQAGQARQLFYMIRELMEIIRPGMTHGDLDEDYKLTVAEIRRFRSLVLTSDMMSDTTVVAIQGDE